MTGRPSSYTEEMADTICERLMDGESLRAICSEADMPSRVTVLKWLNQNEGFASQYTRAREVQADVYFEQVHDIADDGEEDVQRSRLRVDARKWMAGKLAPKKYGEKRTVEHEGGMDVVHLTKEQRDAAVAAALSADDD